MNIEQIIYKPVICLIKCAILLQYLHILAPNRTVNSFMFYGSWAVIVINTGFYLKTTLITIVICHPHDSTWNKSVKDGSCLSLVAPFMLTPPFNIASDLVIILIRSVWKLRIPRRKKTGISMIFATGGLYVRDQKLSALTGLTSTGPALPTLA
jgi:hypothetical protein